MDKRHTGSLHALLLASISLALLWLSFPPVGWSWLAWLAPAPLIGLVLIETLPGRRPYWQLYGAGLVYWLATFYFIPIPHPALWVGWLAISAYMAIFTPMFVGLSRAMVHRFHIPVILAAPVVWTGIESIRCYFATGMALACLSHTQYKNVLVIQVADLFGAYTLTFAMVTVAVGIATLTLGLPRRFLQSDRTSPTRFKQRRISAIISVIISVGVLIGVVSYGQFRLNEEIIWKNESVLKVGMIQTSNDVIFAPLTDEQSRLQFEKKRELTLLARQRWPDLDLIVWPEGGFDPYFDLVSDANDEYTVAAIADRTIQIWSDSTGYRRSFASPVPLLTGAQTIDPENDEFFNAAILISNNGQITHRYYKSHLVMFGEYVPLSKSIPWIQQISPISSTTPGHEFQIVTLNGVNLAPNICFETTVPHYIRRQVNTLAEMGTEPDAMINLTNDGWFYGTSCLDLHLACNIFRAVEMRKPHLICANTGFSAEIDSCGRLIGVGPRRKADVLMAEIRPIVRTSLYRHWGDFVPLLLGCVSLFVGILAFMKKRRPTGLNLNEDDVKI